MLFARLFGDKAVSAAVASGAGGNKDYKISSSSITKDRTYDDLQRKLKTVFNDPQWHKCAPWLKEAKTLPEAYSALREFLDPKRDLLKFLAQHSGLRRPPQGGMGLDLFPRAVQLALLHREEYCCVAARHHKILYEAWKVRPAPG
jgi:hypothetical protein